MQALFSYNNNLPTPNQDAYPTIMDIGCLKKIRINCRNSLENSYHTTTEQAFVPGHLSRQPLGPGQ